MATASPEWMLESQKARAVFSSQDGGRWMEFTWKETNVNFLPRRACLPRRVRWMCMPPGDALEFTGNGWKRTVRLTDATLDHRTDHAAARR